MKTVLKQEKMFSKKEVMIMDHKNGERYRDPTAGEAIKEADKVPDNVSWLIKIFHQIAGLLGYEIVGRIVIRDRKTKRIWR